MSMADVQNLVSALSERDRVELAAWLLESVAGQADDVVLTETATIARQRQADIDSGEAKVLSDQQFWTRIASGK